MTADPSPALTLDPVEGQDGAYHVADPTGWWAGFIRRTGPHRWRAVNRNGRVLGYAPTLYGAVGLIRDDLS